VLSFRGAKGDRESRLNHSFAWTDMMAEPLALNTHPSFTGRGKVEIKPRSFAALG